MKLRKSSKTVRYILIGAAVYLALLVLLVLAESGQEGSGIKNLFLAFWYSITTLTTVGYGDLYPVTPAGRLIGIVFELMSLGILASVIGLLLRLLQGKLLPLLRVRRGADRTWYLFHDGSEEALILAGKLREEDPEGLILLPPACKKEAPASLRAVFADLSPEELLRRKKDPSTAHVFFLGENGFENEKQAASLRETGCRMYVCSSLEKEKIPERTTYFDVPTGCAMLYWRKYPVRSLSERIVLIGGGRIGRALMEQAILNNVFDTEQSVCYEFFGDWEEFRREHPFLDRIVSVGKEEKGSDAVLFKDGPWNADWELFQGADRIVFCDDDERVNAERLDAYGRFCPYSADGTVYAYLSEKTDRAVSFGSAEELFTPGLIMQRELSRRAETIHENYCRSAKERGEKTVSWNELNAFLRRSNTAGADHLAVKARILLGREAEGPADWKEAAEKFDSLSETERDRCRRIEHTRWTRFHVMNNWRYGPVRDNTHRIHPLLTDYDDLTPEDKAKDDYGWELLKEERI